MSPCKRHRESERGSVLFLFAIMIPAVLGMLGLAIDGGNLMTIKRQMQTSADAAALAVANELRIDNVDDYMTAGFADAALNGFEDGGDTEVEINVPPTSGPKAGNSAYAEIIVRHEADLFFMRALGRESADLSTRSVAGLISPDACIYALNPTDTKSLWVTGTADLYLNKCGILVNSSSNTAAVTNGNAVVNAGSIGVVGYYSGSGFSPTPQTDVYPADDPLASLPDPSVGSCNYINTKITSSATLYPGTYCNGIEITANGNVTFQDGIYVLRGGGLSVKGGATVTGDEVMFYVSGGGGYNYDSVSIAGTADVTLSAPTTGTYKGILFFQDRSIASPPQSDLGGNAASLYKGAIYMKTSEVNFHGTSGMNAQEIVLVSDTVIIHGTVDIEATPNGSSYIPPSLAVAKVME